MVMDGKDIKERVLTEYEEKVKGLGKRLRLVVIQVGDKNVETTCTVSAVSGQLKKPRELADGIVLTQTGIKTFLIDKEILPKIEK